MLQIFKNNKGSLLLELVIVIGIIVGVLGAILGLSTFSLLASSTVQQTAEAVALAEEYAEALRNYRDGVPWDQDDPANEYDGFEYVDFDKNPFRLEKSGDSPPQWKLLSVPVSGQSDTVGIFTREIIMEFAHRDANDNIDSSAPDKDDQTVAISIRVSWQERGRTHMVEVANYLTNWQQL